MSYDAGSLVGVCKECSAAGRISPELEALLNNTPQPQKPKPVSCKYCGNRNVVTNSDEENEVICGELRGICKTCSEKRVTKIAIERYAQNTPCPKCKGKLTCVLPRRKGYTYFIGCTNYPKCSYVLPIYKIPDKNF